MLQTAIKIKDKEQEAIKDKDTFKRLFPGRLQG